MTTSFLLKCVRTCSGGGLRGAIALSVGVWLPGCSDANTLTPPPPTPVLSTVTIETVGRSTNVAVGQPLYFTILTSDQFGRPVVVDNVDKRLGDTTHGVILLDSEFGDYLLGAVPGNIVLTATATAGGITRSATKSITIFPSDSGVVEAVGGLGNNWHYAPGTVAVSRSAGDATITWNLFFGSHTVHWDSQPAGGTVADIDSVTAAVVTRHFTVAGTYEYHCLIHSDMIGTIVVE
jgi:plastocyanin